jgi:ribosomal protein L1
VTQNTRIIAGLLNDPENQALVQHPEIALRLDSIAKKSQELLQKMLSPAEKLPEPETQAASQDLFRTIQQVKNTCEDLKRKTP